MFAARGATASPCWPAAPPGSTAPQGRRERRRHRAGHQRRHRRPRRSSRPPPTGSRPSFGPIDVWVNVAFTSVFAPFHHIEPPRSSAGSPRSPTSASSTAPGPRCADAPRDRGTIVQVGSALGHRGIPLQSAYCGAKHAMKGFPESLRTELLHEHSNVHVTSVADARGQHPAVLLGAVPAAPPAAAGTADLPARGRRPRRAVYAADHPRAQAVLGRAQHRRHHHRPNASRPRCWTATWPAPASPPSRPTRRGPAGPPANLWEPADGDDGHDYGAHGPFDDRALGVAPQLWFSHHARLTSAVAAAATAAGLAAATRWLRRR